MTTLQSWKKLETWGRLACFVDKNISFIVVIIMFERDNSNHKPLELSCLNPNGIIVISWNM